MSGRARAGVLIAVLLAAPAPVGAPARAAPREPVLAFERPLRVGFVETPPFATRETDGSWAGMAVELWRHAVDQLGLRWEAQELDTETAFDAVSDGTVDALVGGVVISAEREQRVDFASVFYSAGLGVAIPLGGSKPAMWAVLDGLLTWQFVRVVAALALLLLITGTLIWLFERRRNPHFAGSPGSGIGAGVWWAAVTMTTVGYGDTLPRTGIGRTIALIWMFTSVVLISIFTAAVVSMVTVAHLRGGVQSAADLTHLRLGVVSGTSGARWLDRHHFSYQPFDDTALALDALAESKVDAVVQHMPILRSIIRERWPDRLEVTHIILEHERYAFALPLGSPLRKPLSAAVLDVLEGDDWADIERRYLGPTP